MAILGNVEAKSLRGRLIHAGIILALTVGGLTMIYPFAIMVSGSFRSEVDSSDFDLVPDYLVDDDVLYQKFLETKYNQDAGLINRTQLTDYTSFRSPAPPQSAVSEQDIQRLREYLTDENTPLHWQNLSGIVGIRTTPENLRELRERLVGQYDGDLDAVGRALGAPISSWYNIAIVLPEWNVRRYNYDPNPLFDMYFQMLREAPAAERMPVSHTGLFLQTIAFPRYGSSRITDFNAAHSKKIESYSDFRLPATVPGEDEPTFRTEWLEFAAKELNPSFIVVDAALQNDYAAFQKEIGTEEIHTLTDGHRWLSGGERQIYERFLETLAPEQLQLVGPEYDLADIAMYDTLAHLEYNYVVANSGSLRWRYAVRNYINVFDELTVQGKALSNTVIYCVLALFFALLVNPMAAYAMSRFKLPGTYRVLLVLLATMSFPPMVTMIPQFIMLRKLDLLNSYTALVLPLIANGYMIFLLKGFFDSLPQELYESARIDGASETRMFFQLTMALSKPILAVLALGTFTSAYTAFLYPLLVAPDQDMWLISVWLYQFQLRADSPAVYASVLIASIPTLVIFLFAQRTIMRGIVVPTEK